VTSKKRATSPIDSQVKREENGTIRLVLTLPWNQIRKTYETWEKRALDEVEMPGFRKGKAPREKAQEKINKNKIYERVIGELLPKVYGRAIKQSGLRPVMTPRIRVDKAKEGEDWQFSAIFCEAPEVELGDYKKQIKRELAGGKIWTPGKEKEEKKDLSAEEKEQQILQALLKVVRVKVPDLLVEEEANRKLANLVDKTEKLGLSMEQYLSSIGKTGEELKADYSLAARRAIETEVILTAIFEREKLEMKEEEIDKIIGGVRDEEIKKNLQAPRQRAILKQALARKAALDYLVKLV